MSSHPPTGSLRLLYGVQVLWVIRLQLIGPLVGCHCGRYITKAMVGDAEVKPVHGDLRLEFCCIAQPTNSFLIMVSLQGIVAPFSFFVTGFARQVDRWPPKSCSPQSKENDDNDGCDRR